MEGLIHLYCGDGKGKTTAAMGLALRAAGAGKRVLVTQFYKKGDSSEIVPLASLDNVTVMHCVTVPGLFRRMDPDQRARAAADYTALLERVLEAAANADLLVLDEAVSACRNGTIPEERLLRFLGEKPAGLEVVLTGRSPSPALLDMAHYVTEMKKLRHPFDDGIPARPGIEF